MKPRAIVRLVESHASHAQVAWLESLDTLTASRDAARAWREQRYQFAYRVGEALIHAGDNGTSISGPVVYGVWLRWGLLYVGQTIDARRRLRDLPIGESHHLANTFPPELWERIIVIAWHRLTSARELLTRLGPKPIGLALEHRLLLHGAPLVNSSRRTTQGRWRAVDWSRSRSVGARATDVEKLFSQVRALWVAAEQSNVDGDAPSDVVRCVRPADMLRSSM